MEGSWLCRMDPWKGLEVLWDAADTPSNVPRRVSPWEVLPGTLLHMRSSTIRLLYSQSPHAPQNSEHGKERSRYLAVGGRPGKGICKSLH